MKPPEPQSAPPEGQIISGNPSDSRGQGDVQQEGQH
jgi:hypothetical protein